MSTQARENLSGKVAIVTGASTGIGKEIARGLALRQASVVLGVRDVSRGERARAEMAKEGHNLDLTVMQLDVSSPENVRDFVQRFRKHHKALHILVNNAGAWSTTREVTPEGFERTWATNVLGPYLLTAELLDLLKAGAPSRVVNVASTAAGKLDLDDVQFERRKYSGFVSYSGSKQALRMLSWGLAKRLEGTGVTVNAVNPGFVKTELNRSAGGLFRVIFPVMQSLMAKTPEQGADTPLWVACGQDLEGVSGKFFSDRKELPCGFRDPAQIAELERLCALHVKQPLPA
jgi:NAD(P)-dependent dehydrogenase (short-subunit alcohol dehydrogenase family)